MSITTRNKYAHYVMYLISSDKNQALTDLAVVLVPLQLSIMRGKKSIGNLGYENKEIYEVHVIICAIE